MVGVKTFTTLDVTQSCLFDVYSMSVRCLIDVCSMSLVPKERSQSASDVAASVFAFIGLGAPAEPMMAGVL